MYDPQICFQIAGAMTELQHAAAAGYVQFRSGTVPVEQAMDLASKFDNRYQLQDSKDQRSRRRSKKQATYKLVMYPILNTQDIAWRLLKTIGIHNDDERIWKSMRREHLEWLWRYELIQLPVDPAHRAKYARKPTGGMSKKASAKPGINSVTWTWRIKPSEVKSIKQDIRFYITKSDSRLEQLIAGLRRAPGFRGIRQDVYGLYAFLQRQCRNHKKTCPEIPKTIPWVRNQHYCRVPLSTLVRRAARGESSWFPE